MELTKEYFDEQFSKLAVKDYLDKKLENFVTKEYLDKKLENFVTKEYLDKKLEDFATKDYLDKKLEDFVSKRYLDDKMTAQTQELKEFVMDQTEALASIIQKTIAQPLEDVKLRVAALEQKVHKCP